jgi:exodeoxyribonuclease V alpha subunit
MSEVITKSSVLSLLRQAGYSELAYQFASFIQRKDNRDDELIVFTAALLSEAVSQGHVCLNLAGVGEQGNALDKLLPQRVDDWIKHLRQSHLIGHVNDLAPMILTDSGLLYLYRYWHDEQQVAMLIKRRLQAMPIVDEDQLKQGFSQWHSLESGHDIDWQKIAVLMALTRQFCVISGGPGTGKTTIVLKLLELFLNQSVDLRIALAAPTGKAAARLQQAIETIDQQQIEAKTLHRLLAISEANLQGRYNADNPLPVDVLIIDEASMIDISLMAILLKALPQSTQLILLGDSQQLASVESGAVLANLCKQPPRFSESFGQQVATFTGMNLPSDAVSSPLVDSIVLLQHSYRFDEKSLIGKLASKVKAGDDNAVINYLLTNPENIWDPQHDQAAIQQQVMHFYQDFFEAVKTKQSAETCLKLFEQGRVLCALKQGPESVDSVNYLIERALSKQGWRIYQGFYHGRPIIITQNDYRQRLFNGDTGIVMIDDRGHLAACFSGAEGLRWIALNRLPAHETAYAMTVHKSQGSEFEKVCILLPVQPSPLLTRELFYTAVTRAKEQIMILASENSLRQTVSSQHLREMGFLSYF